MRSVILTAGLLALLACPAWAQQPAASPGDLAPLAQVGERIVTTRDVDERWQADSPIEHGQAKQTLYEGRRAALDAIVADLLLERAARAAGATREDYESREVARRVRPVTDADIAAFYAENRAQMEGRPLEEMAPTLREFLDERNSAEALAALVSDLKKAEPGLRVLLDPPRQSLNLPADAPAEGPTDAPVTLVEFSDFQCPFCQRLAPTLRRVRDAYGDRVRIVWQDFPLSQTHPQALLAAEAGHCAHEQGRFWEYHDRLFANQKLLQATALKEHAAELKLDVAQFTACLDSSKYASKVRDAAAAGSRLGVNATPTSFVNGRMISGAKPFEAFAAIIDDELARSSRR